MSSEFEGSAGRTRLVDAIRGQFIVRGNDNLANRIADVASIAVHAPGAEIIREGGTDNEIFLILRGRVSIVIGGKEVAHRTAGQHVGEIVLINPSLRRSASVIAIEETVTARIDEPDFTSLADKVPILWRLLAGDLGDRIGQYKVHEEELEYVAHHDTLTGLANRRLLHERLEQTILRCHRTSGECALLFIDLDKFKPINDEHGHDVGDKLLKLAAQRMDDCVRATDTVARLGGDEFVVLLDGLGDSQNAEVVAGKLVEALRFPFEIDQLTLSISASVGIATYPVHGMDAETLLKRADEALYCCKSEGRNGFRTTQ